ncbi:hypothetical protein SPHV1_470017 [Novosphingobium sp. KN65.2]|nr:hypothetical protein SPHV1_470017 [Novosphingobium sp. KN65.2]
MGKFRFAVRSLKHERFPLADGRADGAPSALFSMSHRRERVDDPRDPRGIILVNRVGLRQRDTPRDHALEMSLYNQWERWSDRGSFNRLTECLAHLSPPPLSQDEYARRRPSQSAPYNIQPWGEKGGRDA